MKRPPPDEEAALEAAFSFTDAIDAINQFQSESIEKISGKISLKKKVCKDLYTLSADPWNDWRFVADELIDPAGNRYGQNEIQAIFYNRKRLRYLDQLEKATRPVMECQPVQLNLPIDPAWKTLCQERR